MRVTDKMWVAIIATFSLAGGSVSGLVQHALEDPPPTAPIVVQPYIPTSPEVLGSAPGPESPCQTITCERLPYWNWLIPTGKICVEVRGSVYATQAALQINAATDVDMIPARSNCLGYPRTNVVKLVPRDLGTETCAMTSGTTARNGTVRGVPAMILDDPTIWYNTNPALLKSCFGTAFAAKHVYGHELLHALGLKHTWGIASLVAAKPPAGSGLTDYSWKYSATTAWDNAETNRRY